MANNYTLASFVYPLDELTEEQAEEIINKRLAEIAEEDGWDDPEDVCFGNMEFEGSEIWFSHDETFDPEIVVSLISCLQQAKKSAKVFSFGYCYTCDKARVDEFGGGAFAVNPDGEIFHVSPVEAVEKLAKKAWQDAGHLGDDEFRCDRCGAVEDIEDSIKQGDDYLCTDCADQKEDV